LLGRAAFFLSWSVATVVFPAAARRHAAGERTDLLLRGGIGVVTAIGGLCALATALFGDLFIELFLGSNYRNLGGLLTVYVVSSTLFAVSNLVASHHMAAGRTTESWALLCGGVLQVALMLLWNDTMQELVRGQLVAMTVLVVLVAVCGTARKSSPPPMVERATSR
jgi:O-antigen/teichoic acid export membrane protein